MAIPIVLLWLMISMYLGQESLQTVWLDAKIQSASARVGTLEAYSQWAMGQAKKEANERIYNELSYWGQLLETSDKPCIEGVCALARLTNLPSVITDIAQDHWIWEDDNALISSPYSRHLFIVDQDQQSETEVWKLQIWTMVKHPENDRLIKINMTEVS